MVKPLSSLATRLQTTLGPSFAIERELGGGGMSHVFLVADAALSRRIVVKILPPEPEREGRRRAVPARDPDRRELAASVHRPGADDRLHGRRAVLHDAVRGR